MKLCCFKNLFLLSIICVPFLFLDSSGATKFQRSTLNNTVIGGGNDEQVENGAVGEMVSDDSLPGREEDGNVVLTRSGPINLTITSGDLQLRFEVCKEECTGLSYVCYETKNSFIDPKAAGSCSSISSTCEFKVEGKDDAVWFGRNQVRIHGFITSCVDPNMEYKYAKVFNQKFESCDPKIDPVEKMIKLHAYVVSSCPIKVILATASSQTTPKPKDTTPFSQAKESTADAGFPWWAYLIIAAVCVLVLIVIGAIVYYVCFKKPKSSKALPQPETVVTAKRTTKVKVAPDVQPPTTTTAAPPAAAAAETKDAPSSTRKEDLNFTKFEPSKKSKKIQKKAKKGTTTQEPTTIEDVPPAPGSRQPVFDLSNAPEPVPVPYPKPHRLVPRSMKSAKTDSLEKTLPKEKKEMIETVHASVERHCLKSSESDVVQEMKTNYPEIQRDVLEAETELLGLPVSQMFKRIDGLARESKRKLSVAGCKFDKNRCITFVPEGVRSMLQDEKTAATTVYFAFGAEYHKHVKCDKLIFYSLPLLMVIALQKRFETRDRRKACALIRRKMPIVLANNTEAARQKMPYPMNAIEKAYCRNPIPFRKLSDIKTDSEDERRMNEMKEAAAAAEKKETVPGGGHDAKRKKKSSKLR